MPGESDANRSRETLGRAGVIGAATMTSRVLGLLREHIFAKLFGASFYSDAFQIAYRIPNLLRDLFAEGALSSAFVPVFTDYRVNRGDREAFGLAHIVFTALFAVVGGLTLLALIFTPAIVDAIAPGFSDEPGPGGESQRDLTIRLTRWMLPFLLLVSLAALCRGILNSHRRYFLPALSPALFNVVAVATGYGLWWAGTPVEGAVLAWAAATVVGGAVTFLIQTPPLWGLGMRFRFRFRLAEPGFRRVVRLMAPATIGLAAVQVNIFVNSAIASTLETGAISWLNYAFRLVYLPVGVIGVAIATVASVELSRDAARADRTAFRDGLSGALRLVSFLAFPATVGLLVLAEPIVDLIFGYGRFAERAENSGQVALALRWYATGLVFFCGVKVLAPAFYALNRIRTPVAGSILAVAVNLAWSLSTYRTLGFQTLAVGSALAGLINFAVLAVVLRRSLGPSPRGDALAFGAKVTIVGALQGVAAWLTHGGAAWALGDASFWARGTSVGSAILVAVTVWLAAGRGLRLAEAGDMLAVIRRRRSE